MEVRALEIPVPWGHIAVKAWGKEEDIPVLVLHGWRDNAGTFDRLIPYLPHSFYYLCADLPSHGKSSHYPPHVFINAVDNVLSIKIMLDYLNRKKYIVIGHSWGAQAEIMFSQLYPESVLKLIIIDAFYSLPVMSDIFKDYLRNRIATLIRTNDNLAKSRYPTYTYNEAIAKQLRSRSDKECSRETAEPILKRSLIPVGNGKFRFSTDPRLNARIDPLFGYKYTMEILKRHPIKCPVLFILSENTVQKHSDTYNILMEFAKHCGQNWNFKNVKGGHDIHNTKPELVGPIITTFLSNTKSNL